MKALVTGGTGFIGSHVVDLLLERGYHVRCTIRKTSNLRWLEGKPVELVEASLGNLGSLSRAVDAVDYIVHIAGLVAARNYEEFLKGNRDGTRNLVDAAILHAPYLKRFVHVSSLTVAGPARSVGEPVTEDMPCKPLTSYAKSKLAAEEEVIKAKNMLPVTIVRPPAVYGPRDTGIFQIFKTAQQGLATLIGMKPNYLSLIHCADLSRGIVDAAESEATVGNVYYISSDEYYTWDQLMDIIKASLNRKFIFKIKIPHPIVLVSAALSGFFGRFMSKPPIFNYEKGIDFIQDYWICSTGKARKDFGYSQQVTIEEGIGTTIHWYKENGWLKA